MTNPTETYTLTVIDGVPSEGGQEWALAYETLPGVTDDDQLVAADLTAAMLPIIEALKTTARKCGEYSPGDRITVQACSDVSTDFEHTFEVSRRRVLLPR